MSAVFRGAPSAAFDGLYRRHAATVYRYVYAVLGNHADAEDVTQTTFLNAYRSLGQGTKPRKAENWLLTIAHNELRQHFRSTRSKPRLVELDDRLAEAEPEHDRSEPSVSDVLRALQHLPESQRAALVMREFEGRSYAEMAEILGVTQSALETLLFRARRSLAERLEGALTCGEAELALSRKLDGRLPRSEGRRLRAHLRECPACARFDDLQRRQRKLVKGLAVMPVPASIFLFRGETAAAAGVGAGAAAAGGTATVGGGAAAAGLAGGLAAKAAAVTAAAAVVTGGVGYGVTKTNHDGAKAEQRAAHTAAVSATRQGGRAADVAAAKAAGQRPGPARTASERAQEIATTKTSGSQKSNSAATRRSTPSSRPSHPTTSSKPAVPPGKAKADPAATKPVKPTKPVKEPPVRQGQPKPAKPVQAKRPPENRAGAEKVLPNKPLTPNPPTEKPVRNPNAGQPGNAGQPATLGSEANSANPPQAEDAPRGPKN